MVARSQSLGYDIEYDGKQWIRSDTKESIECMTCKHCGKKESIVSVWIDPRQSHTGKGYWKSVPIDHCIAPLVEALQLAGINMLGSCCGHGKSDGEILLADGRILKLVRRGGVRERKEELEEKRETAGDETSPGCPKTIPDKGVI